MSSNSKLKIITWYGSKTWADAVLSLGIQECRNFERVRSTRLAEIDYFIEELYLNGWAWHSRILRSWKYRFWRYLQPKADSLQGREGDHQ